MIGIHVGIQNERFEPLVLVFLIDLWITIGRSKTHYENWILKQKACSHGFWAGILICSPA